MRLIKNISFRFCFFYFFLTIAPWMLLADIPGINYLTEFYAKGFKWIVFRFNDWFLHVKDVLNTEGFGSGDTSYAWAEFYTILILSLLLAVLWSLVDNKRNDNVIASYWLRTLVRYNIAVFAFSYGFIKLFALQMPFPTLSQLATPLGDFLPMRLCWMHLGYSVPYQTFSGIMEIIVGLLLLFRKTTPMGLLIGLGVFVNVFALNLSYDIPVKLFSMQLVICCLFLLVWDYKQYLNFLVFNTATKPFTSYDFSYTKKWQRIGRYVLKTIFVIFGVGFSFYDAWDWRQQNMVQDKSIIKQGVYTIKAFKKNNQTQAIASNDTLVWKDFIFDKGGMGSINTCDTLFKVKYGRGYFGYVADEQKQTIAFKITPTDSTNLFVMKYKILNNKTIQLQGNVRKDTLFYELERNDKKFPLAERQFHWISEANR